MPTQGSVRASAAGVLAAALTLGVAEFVMGIVADGRSLVVALGDVVIDSVPGALERAVIAALGTNDKPFLIANILLVSAFLGAGAGLLARRRFRLGAALLATMTALAVAASLADPQVGAVAPIAAGLVGGAAGIATLWGLLFWPARAISVERRPGTDPAGGGVADRRRFLAAAAGAVLLAGTATVGGRLLAARGKVERLRQTIRLPRPARPAPAAPAGATLPIPGITPLYVPNDRFYRIDTALIVPQVDPARWTLEVKGLVEKPFTLTYAELLALPHVEADITLSCVSNEVGGGLVGNARWQGVPLRALLERAHVLPAATQVLGRSVDGFTAGFPTEVALDGRDALVAVAMNGEPLPTAHGFPARIVVPGLYGYVSAVKWLSSIELTRLEDVDGYWIPRGWAKEAPVKTQSRIDVVRDDVIAGVAWAPTRGIERVEVRIDGGPWNAATLAAALGRDSWRQWFLPWQGQQGREYVVAVRATDGAGNTQTAERTDVAPDGASGHHTLRLRL